MPGWHAKAKMLQRLVLWTLHISSFARRSATIL